jgi:hypothetical protein
MDFDVALDQHHLEKLGATAAIKGITELIWNALDADASEAAIGDRPQISIVALMLAQPENGSQSALNVRLRQGRRACERSMGRAAPRDTPRQWIDCGEVSP